ncbi:MAG: dihydrodipicolinate synthase family protein [Gemmatimonadales bacterium]|nr:dihydrodipicolinate synthase family protein [Gemmatimonadales bacterium]
MNWEGVMPAITTPFTADGGIDHEFVRTHVRWLADHGSTAIIPCGSLGEGATLDAAEKVALMHTCVTALENHVPVAPGIAAASTKTAVWLCQKAAEAGCSGLMILPPYLHKGEWYEIGPHFEAMLDATDLSCMLYNNPAAYGTDVLPEQIAELSRQHANLVAVKESSGDVRRITAIRALCGDRLTVAVGLDDVIVEGIAMGARGWVAGLVNAFPAESVRLFELARDDRHDDAFILYRWFLPLLRMDTVPEFVQLIKLVQAEVGMGSERVRAPRRPVSGAAREAALATIQAALENRPT